MKRKKDKLKKLLIFNALFLALSVVITINLLETGGLPSASPEAAPQSTQQPAAATTAAVDTPAETPVPEE